MRQPAQGGGGPSSKRLHRRLRFFIAGGVLALATALSMCMPPALAHAATPGLKLISPPTISGTAEVGQTLSEGHAVWNITPLAFAYQWQACDSSGQHCAAIDNASEQTYAVASSQLGGTLRVEETAFSWLGLGQAFSAVTAKVTDPPAPRSSSTTSLTAVESSAITDQPVTLIATVTSSSSFAAPSGTLTFDDQGAAIGGCQNDTVRPTGQSVTMTCQTSFAASTAELTAAFTPAAGSFVGGSASAPDTFAVDPAPTATSVDASRGSVHVGHSVTYTATVQPSYLGPLQPSQTVGFFDSGQPIPTCTARPVAWAGTAALATCSVSYAEPGEHLVTASYAGDSNFTGSTSSPAQLVDVTAGKTHAMLSWSFYYTPRYTTVLVLTIGHVLRGATVRVTCTGRGCPLAARSVDVRHSALAAGGVNLVPWFRGHRLRPGAVIAVTVGRHGLIGKVYTFKIRAGRPPRLSTTCQAPGLPPGAGC